MPENTSLTNRQPVQAFPGKKKKNNKHVKQISTCHQRSRTHFIFYFYDSKYMYIIFKHTYVIQANLNIRCKFYNFFFFLQIFLRFHAMKMNFFPGFCSFLSSQSEHTHVSTDSAGIVIRFSIRLDLQGTLN